MKENITYVNNKPVCDLFLKVNMIHSTVLAS